MIVKETYRDLAGNYRFVVEVSGERLIELKYQSIVSNEIVLGEIQKIIDAENLKKEVDSWMQVDFSLKKNELIIEDFVAKVKSNPNLTLNQYNTYLNSKQWYESSLIRFFIFQLSIGLSERFDISLAGETETSILSAVKNWIIETPANKIRKIVYGSIS